MTDHDAIAARVRQDMKAGTPGLWRVGPVDDTIVTAADGSEVAAVDGDYNEPDLWPIMEANARRIATLPDLEAAYLDLYDEVKRLRAALEIITMMHDGNPPLPLADMPSVEYARRTIRNIHQEARAALKGTSE